MKNHFVKLADSLDKCRLTRIAVFGDNLADKCSANSVRCFGSRSGYSVIVEADNGNIVAGKADQYGNYVPSKGEMAMLLLSQQGKLCDGCRNSVLRVIRSNLDGNAV
jgi:hypothetical protein